MITKLNIPKFAKVTKADEIFGFEKENGVLYFEDEAHKYTKNGVQLPSVTTIIKHAPEIFGFGYPDTIPEFVLRRAGARGTHVHTYAEHVVDGTLPNDFDKVLPFGRTQIDVTGYCDAIDKFLADYEVVALSQEDMFAYTNDSGKHDSEHLYAGTVDFIGYVNDELCVLDWKTQKEATPLKWAIQLCAYSRMIHQQTKVLCPTGYIVHVNNDGEYFLWKFDMSMTPLWNLLVDYYHYVVVGEHVEMADFIEDVINVIDDESLKASLPSTYETLKITEVFEC